MGGRSLQTYLGIAKNPSCVATLSKGAASFDARYKARKGKSSGGDRSEAANRVGRLPTSTQGGVVSVFVLDKQGKALMRCSEKRASKSSLLVILKGRVEQ